MQLISKPVSLWSRHRSPCRALYHTAFYASLLLVSQQKCFLGRSLLLILSYSLPLLVLQHSRAGVPCRPLSSLAELLSILCHSWSLNRSASLRHFSLLAIFYSLPLLVSQVLNIQAPPRPIAFCCPSCPTAFHIVLLFVIQHTRSSRC